MIGEAPASAPEPTPSPSLSPASAPDSLAPSPAVVPDSLAPSPAVVPDSLAPSPAPASAASPAPAPDSLAPAPAGSRWGRRVAGVYLVVVVVAFAVLVYELVRGERGLGSIALSVLTAPWSAALSMLAQALAGSLPEAAMRALGFALAAASALLNARILYGMAARAERDARGGR